MANRLEMLMITRTNLSRISHRLRKLPQSAKCFYSKMVKHCALTKIKSAKCFCLTKIHSTLRKEVGEEDVGCLILLYVDVNVVTN